MVSVDVKHHVYFATDSRSESEDKCFPIMLSQCVWNVRNKVKRKTRGLIRIEVSATLFRLLLVYLFTSLREPVWPSGKALGWSAEAEGPRFESASALLSLQKGCGLWTLSCDFVRHFLLKH